MSTEARLDFTSARTTVGNDGWRSCWLGSMPRGPRRGSIRRDRRRLPGRYLRGRSRVDGGGVRHRRSPARSAICSGRGTGPGRADITVPELAAQVSGEMDELVVVPADVPDLPALVLAKVFKALQRADIVLAPERTGADA